MNEKVITWEKFWKKETLPESVRCLRCTIKLALVFLFCEASQAILEKEKVLQENANQNKHKTNLFAGIPTSG